MGIHYDYNKGYAVKRGEVYLISLLEPKSLTPLPKVPDTY